MAKKQDLYQTGEVAHVSSNILQMIQLKGTLF